MGESTKVLIPLSTFAKLVHRAPSSVWRLVAGGRPLPYPGLAVWRYRGDLSKLLVEVATSDVDLELHAPSIVSCIDHRVQSELSDLAVARGFSVSDVARLFSKLSVSTEGCWVWMGTSNGDGRGMTVLGGKAMSAPRASLLLFVGPPSAGKHHALHACDNPPCVNPAHLRWGSPSDNMADQAARGRIARGEHNGSHMYPEAMERGDRRWNAKLTDDLVREIRELASGGGRHDEIACKYCVSISVVRKIAAGESWAHVNGPRSNGGLSPKRMRKGEAHHASSLSDVQVTDVKRALMAGAKIRTTAVELGVSQTVIQSIAHGKTGTHVAVDGFVPMAPRMEFRAKLNADRVQMIKDRLSTGETIRALSLEYGVSFTAVHNIATGRTWRDGSSARKHI